MHSATGYQLVKLASGVQSVRSLAHGETFHPVIGPVAEAEALYVRQLELRKRLQVHAGEFVIWDVGLGAAANPLAVLRATRDIPARLRIVSFDHTLEPLDFALRHTEALGYFYGYEHSLHTLLKAGRVSFHNGKQSIEWELHQADFPTLLARAATGPLARRLARVPTPVLPPPHAIMFDAFSPATNPAMWTLPLFSNLYRQLDPHRPCAMPTYSRSTLLRVTLLLAGFCVGRGHATGKKEETTLAANTLDLIDEPLDRRWLARARRSTSAEPLREPIYQQARLSPETWEKLQQHPQFSHNDTARPG